jgi:hypothetical protein
VPESGLQRPGVVAGIGQRVAATVAQHVRMDGERHLGPNANAAKQGMEAFGRHRAAALGLERVFLPQCQSTFHQRQRAASVGLNFQTVPPGHVLPTATAILRAASHRARTVLALTSITARTARIRPLQNLLRRRLAVQPCTAGFHVGICRLGVAW